GNDNKYVDDLYKTVSESLDCLYHLPCSLVSPLKTNCDGLDVECADNVQSLLESSEEPAMKKGGTALDVVCPTPHLMYHSSGSNQWNLINAITCQKDGRWLLKSDTETTIDAGDR
ncbi:hypothetical protein PFISCL1PPCAC_17297, partial [Pristionchus fissidentatus]